MVLVRWMLPAVSLLASAALADGPLRVDLKAGQSKAMGHLVAPICDDPAVAVMSGAGDGVIKAIAAGKTLCSATTLVGLRQVYEVVVTGTAPPEELPAPDHSRNPRKGERPPTVPRPSLILLSPDAGTPEG